MEIDGKEVQTVVIDNGSGTLKGGFSGEETPQTTFSNAVGFTKYPSIEIGNGAHQDYYISEEAQEKAGVLSLKYPISHGIIKNWENMEKIWKHTLYSELRIDPVEHPVLFSCNVGIPSQQNEKIAQIMFEKYNIPAICFKPSDELTLLASGRTSGIVLESGEGSTTISAIYEDLKIPQSLRITKIGGSSLTSFLMKKLSKETMKFYSYDEIAIARSIKETCCYVSENFEEESKAKAKETTFKYPDGQILKLDDIVYKVPEFMFNPHVLGLKSTGIHTLLADSIQSCDIHMQKSFWNNICIGGGNTLFKGFTQRIEKEMRKVAPKDTKIRTFASKRRGNAVWIGGAVLSSQATFTDIVIPKKDFVEQGASIISLRCK